LPIDRTCECARALATAIITRPEVIPPATRARLEPIIGRYLPQEAGSLDPA
jgi:5'-methylthioadenosine phosphorylase